jgi:molybdenum cofactor synthesis domain-containing protein
VTTVAAVIIGNEILTGKVRDTNTPLLVDLLREAGVNLGRLVVIGDDPDEIAAEVERCAAVYDAVVTSGGLGPTHDDRTVEGVAAAFGVGVVRHPEVEAMIRAFWGERLTEAALRMADMPDGSRLLHGDDSLLPLVVCRNVYLLPGVPELFAAKLASLRRELSGTRRFVRSVFLSSYESDVAELLTRVDAANPEVQIGSYPRFGHGDHRLWVTFEGADETAVHRAVAALLELVPAADVVRTEPD